MDELELINIEYTYPGSKKKVLENVTISFGKGEMTAITGESGAGKSTLLYLIAGLDRPTSGFMRIESQVVSNLRLYRRTMVSYISQSYLLFPSRTVIENVMYPLELRKINRRISEEKAKQYLNKVGIGKTLWNRLPNKLSGGEQQRVAIARCLVADTDIIVADEPTGNLDEKNANQVMALLRDIAHDREKIVIVVTHDIAIAKMADIHLNLNNATVRQVYM